MVKMLDKDLTIAPPAEGNHTAHVMADEFDGKLDQLPLCPAIRSDKPNNQRKDTP